MKKRVLSLVLVIALLVSLIPVTSITAYAEDEEESLSAILLKIIGRASTAKDLEDFLDSMGDVPTYSKFTGEKSYRTYLSLGDSTAFGYGLGTLAPDQADFHNTFGWGKADSSSWTYKLAGKLGIEFTENTCTESNESETPWYLDLTQETNHFAALAIGNVRISDVNFLLGNDDAYDGYTENCLFNIYKKYCHIPDGEDVIAVSQEDAEGGNLWPECVYQMRELIKTNVENADLISVALGGNDFGTYLNDTLLSGGNDLYWMNWDYLWEKNPELKEIKDALSELISAIVTEENTDIGSETLENVASLLSYAYIQAITEIGEVVDAIHALNPEADILLASLFNPYEDFVVRDPESGATLYVGKIVSILLASINQFYRLCAVKHPSWCCFVDTSETEFIVETDQPDMDYNILTNPDFLSQMGRDWGMYSHETAKGHTIIAEAAYEALGKPEPYDESTSGEKTERTPLSLTEHLEKIQFLKGNLADAVETVVGDQGKEEISEIQSRLASIEDAGLRSVLNAVAVTGVVASRFTETAISAMEDESQRTKLEAVQKSAAELTSASVAAGKFAYKAVTETVSLYRDLKERFPMSVLLVK